MHSRFSLKLVCTKKSALDLFKGPNVFMLSLVGGEKQLQNKLSKSKTQLRDRLKKIDGTQFLWHEIHSQPFSNNILLARIFYFTNWILCCFRFFFVQIANQRNYSFKCKRSGQNSYRSPSQSPFYILTVGWFTS